MYIQPWPIHVWSHRRNLSTTATLHPLTQTPLPKGDPNSCFFTLSLLSLQGVFFTSFTSAIEGFLLICPSPEWQSCWVSSWCKTPLTSEWARSWKRARTSSADTEVSWITVLLREHQIFLSAHPSTIRTQQQDIPSLPCAFGSGCPMHAFPPKREQSTWKTKHLVLCSSPSTYHEGGTSGAVSTAAVSHRPPSTRKFKGYLHDLQGCG